MVLLLLLIVGVGVGVLLAPVPLHEGERRVVAKLFGFFFVVGEKGGDVVRLDRSCCAVRFFSFVLIKGRAKQVVHRQGMTNIKKIATTHLLLLRRGPAGVGVDPAVRLARGGACFVMVDVGSGERKCTWMYTVYIRPVERRRRRRHPPPPTVYTHKSPSPPPPNPIIHTHTNIYTRTGDGLHDALHHHGLKKILAPANLLRHVGDHRVRVRIDLLGGVLVVGGLVRG